SLPRARRSWTWTSPCDRRSRLTRSYPRDGDSLSLDFAAVTTRVARLGQRRATATLQESIRLKKSYPEPSNAVSVRHMRARDSARDVKIPGGLRPLAAASTEHHRSRRRGQ